MGLEDNLKIVLIVSACIVVLCILTAIWSCLRCLCLPCKCLRLCCCPESTVAKIAFGATAESVVDEEDMAFDYLDEKSNSQAI